MKIQQTSIDAKRFVDRNGIALNHKKKIYALILHQGGKTCEEVETEFSMRHQTASARIRGLVKDKRICDSGIRRKTGSGRAAIVWKVKTASDNENTQIKFF